jgi:hypothetical protein
MHGLCPASQIAIRHGRAGADKMKGHDFRFRADDDALDYAGE